MTDKELLQKVKNGTPDASAHALVWMILNDVGYPGSTEDIVRLTEADDMVLGFPLAGFAWAYLDSFGMASYQGADADVRKYIAYISPRRGTGRP